LLPERAAVRLLRAKREERLLHPRIELLRLRGSARRAPRRAPADPQRRCDRGKRIKRMKGFEPSTFAMASLETRPEARKQARFGRLNMA
jgi:hypothetical protein